MARRRTSRLLRSMAALVVVGLLPLVGVLPSGAQPPGPNPVATDERTYQLFGRVWSDPHGCLVAPGRPVPPGTSPWAKGSACMPDYLTYQEAVDGARFLASRFPDLVSVVRLDEAYGDPAMRSLGVPRTASADGAFTRDRKPLYLLKVTDRTSQVPEADREHFAYSLSIHGLERGGAEGGLRAMEDLVTWAACERPTYAASTPACTTEGPFPKKIVESETSSPVPTAGEVLRSSVVYFMLANPDGWVAGERSVVDTTDGTPSGRHQPGGLYTRGNGHGVDLNRDWPTVGYTFKRYSPGSEPEVRAFGKALTDIRDRTSAGRFAGGIDLHNMLDAYAFSYTLLGAGQRDYRKNAITVDTSVRTWEDQTARVCWSPYVADGDCDGTAADGEECFTGASSGTNGRVPACVADQWGTVLDTLGYTITGGLGDWMDSPIGLDGVGINNEMYLSIVFEPALVQTQIDGNKGLIFSQISALLHESEALFTPGGRVGYVHNPTRLQVAGHGRPDHGEARPQDPISVVLPCAADGCAGGAFALDGTAATYAFDVRPEAGNGGLTASFASAQAGGQPLTVAFTVQHLVEGQWQTVAPSAQGAGLVTSASAVASLNDPAPGRYRVRFANAMPGRLTVAFDAVEAEASPGQAAIDASSMDFFDDLNRYVPEASRLQRVAVDEVVAGGVGLDRFDTLVVVGDLGSRDWLVGTLELAEDQADAYLAALRGFAERGGNLVLTDAALAALPALGLGAPADVVAARGLAGFYHFEITPGLTTYRDPQRFPLAAGIDLPGAAEGQPGRRQAVEPTPLGYTPSTSLDATPLMPFSGVRKAAWEQVCGLPDCVVATSARHGSVVHLGEAALGEGRVRIAGSLLPNPVFEPDAANDHRFGLASYALTYTAYQLVENLLDYRRER